MPFAFCTAAFHIAIRTQCLCPECCHISRKCFSHTKNRQGPVFLYRLPVCHESNALVTISQPGASASAFFLLSFSWYRFSLSRTESLPLRGSFPFFLLFFLRCRASCSFFSSKLSWVLSVASVAGSAEESISVSPTGRSSAPVYSVVFSDDGGEGMSVRESFSMPSADWYCVLFCVCKCARICSMTLSVSPI